MADRFFLRNSTPLGASVLRMRVWRACAVNPLPFDCKTLAHNGRTHKQRKWLVIIHEQLGAHVHRPHVGLIIMSVLPSTHPLQMKRSDLIECKGLPLVQRTPLGITGRIESLNSIGRYNCSEARYFSFLELDPRVLKTIISPMGWALACNTISTSCHGDADTLWGHFLLLVFWLFVFWRDDIYGKLIRTGRVVPICSNETQTEAH